MEPLIPLIVPTVNTHHLGMIPYQQKEMLTINNNGFIVTNANCSTTGLVVPLRALIDTFGAIDKLIVTTMQAISGAGT